MPGISRNWRRTSTMIDCAVVPTARMASELKKYAEHRAEQRGDEDVHVLPG